MFVMALAEVCEALKGHEKIEAWEQAMKLHGEYLKKLKVYTQPYGMLPAGIHHISEIDDKATFDVLHPTAEYEAEKANYKKMVSTLETDIILEDSRYGSHTEGTRLSSCPWEKRLLF